MSERHRTALAVYALLRRDGLVLLLRRAGSGYHDGELSLPAGHVEVGEHAVDALRRELREEVGIEVDAAALAVTVHRARETEDDHDYVDLFFAVDDWSGEPTIGEPDTCTELVWADPNSLPDDVIGYVDRAISAATSGRTLLVEGWPA